MEFGVAHISSADNFPLDVIVDRLDELHRDGGVLIYIHAVSVVGAAPRRDCFYRLSIAPGSALLLC